MDLTIMLFPSPLLSCISLSAFETDAEDNERGDGGREGAAEMVEQKEVCTVYQPVVHPLYAPSQS